MTTPRITYLSDIQAGILASLEREQSIIVHGKYIGDVLSLQMQGLVTHEVEGDKLRVRRATTTEQGGESR